MKRLILSTSMVMLVAAAFAPIASANQASTTQGLPEGATLTDLIRHNRDVRDKS